MPLQEDAQRRLRRLPRRLRRRHPLRPVAPALERLLPNSSLAIGLVILGLCIGLLIGLAQVVLKEAWLKVESGFRAGREVMLSKDETTIGRAESCDIGLFGDNTIERLHARIQLQEQPVFPGRRRDAGRDVPQRQAGAQADAAARRRPDPRRQ